MGILVHPNHEAEKANGVGVSTDPIYKTAGTFYLNTQLGADLVTNPNALSVPEEILLDAVSGTDDDYFVMNPSNQVPKVPDWTGILVHLPIHHSSFLLEEKVLILPLPDALSPITGGVGGGLTLRTTSNKKLLNPSFSLKYHIQALTNPRCRKV